MTWQILKSLAAITAKSTLRGEVLGGWFLLSAKPVRTWLPVPRCVDRYCPERTIYLLHRWAWSPGKGKTFSIWLEYQGPMTVRQWHQEEAFNMTVTIPTLKLHVERPWAVRRWMLG